MGGLRCQLFPQLVPLGLLNLCPFTSGREFVGFIHDEEVPRHLRQEVANLLFAGKVHGDDDLRIVLEKVRGDGLPEELAV
jgi:hypothetical protein